MMIMDSDQRIILQNLSYGLISKGNDIVSTMLPMEHSLERDIPEIRSEMNVFKVLQSKYKPRKEQKENHHNKHKKKEEKEKK